MKKINWNKIIQIVLDPCKNDRETLEKERLKRTVQDVYEIKLVRAVEARKRANRTTV